jgi:hypothetical protein
MSHGGQAPVRSWEKSSDLVALYHLSHLDFEQPQPPEASRRKREADEKVAISATVELSARTEPQAEQAPARSAFLPARRRGD